jgi:NAD(P)H dehydrogenase (quinone)
LHNLIIYAHPDHESHAKYTLQLVTDKLSSRNQTFEVIDLYKIKFNPILSSAEIYDRTKGPPKDVLNFHDKIMAAEHLIFIYPIWWNTMPAILKGFFDRVFTAGFGFRYVNAIPVGLLKGKTATAFVTTGSSNFLTWFFLGNRFKDVIKKDILGFCGIPAKVYHTDHAYAFTDYQKLKLERNVNKALG